MYLYGIEISKLLKQERMPCYCFNCTFMELKYKTAVPNKPIVVGFNCTFMELKYYLSSYCVGLSSVLIVPLWN